MFCFQLSECLKLFSRNKGNNACIHDIRTLPVFLVFFHELMGLMGYKVFDVIFLENITTTP